MKSYEIFRVKLLPIRQFISREVVLTNFIPNHLGTSNRLFPPTFETEIARRVYSELASDRIIREETDNWTGWWIRREKEGKRGEKETVGKLQVKQIALSVRVV